MVEYTNSKLPGGTADGIPDVSMARLMRNQTSVWRDGAIDEPLRVSKTKAINRDVENDVPFCNDVRTGSSGSDVSASRSSRPGSPLYQGRACWMTVGMTYLLVFTRTVCTSML